MIASVFLPNGLLPDEKYILQWYIHWSRTDAPYAKQLFSYNLKKLISNKGTSARQISIDINIPYTTFMDWINEKKIPRSENLDRLTEYFHVPVAYFFQEEDTPILTAEEKELLLFFRRSEPSVRELLLSPLRLEKMKRRVETYTNMVKE